MDERDYQQVNDTFGDDDMLNEGTRALSRVFRVFLILLTVLMICCMIFYFFSGLFILETGKVAVVQRFGKLTAIYTQPGWYWTLPKYIDSHIKFKVEERRSFTLTDFWYKETGKTALDNPNRKKTPPDENEPLRVGEGGYLLSADNNIIHSKWVVIYRIADVKDFYFNYREPEAVLKYCLRDAILQSAAKMKIDEMLKDDSGRWNRETRALFVKKVQSLKLGVEILQVNLQDKVFPRATSKAFTAVTDASNEADRLIKDAIGFANREQEKARGEADRVKQEALAYKRKIVDSAFADARYLKSIQEQYRESGASILLPEYVQVLTRLVNNTHQTILLYPDQEIRLHIEPEPLGREQTSNGQTTENSEGTSSHE